MPSLPTLKIALKRGALLAAANWPVVLVQFVAESTYKLILAVPVIGGALLVVLLLGGSAAELPGSDLRDMAAVIAAALKANPAALSAFVLAVGVVALGGAVLMFLIKGGTVSVLAEAEFTAEPVERPPLRLAALRDASRFTIHRFLAGCARLFRRYLAFGLVLFAVYAGSGVAYVVVVLGSYRLLEGAGLLVFWTVFAVFCSSVLVVWIMMANLVYLLAQMIAAVDDLGVRATGAQVVRFVRGCLQPIAAIFGIVLVLVVVATIGSVLAAGGLGLIAFVPFAGLVVFPLQLAAWLLRGLLFQYLGLAALGAYLAEYRAFARPRARRADPALAVDIGPPRAQTA